MAGSGIGAAWSTRCSGRLQPSWFSATAVARSRSTRCSARSSEVLKAAVVGLGWWGKQITRCLANSEHVRVTHGVEVQPRSVIDFAREQSLRVSESLDEILADRT